MLKLYHNRYCKLDNELVTVWILPKNKNERKKKSNNTDDARNSQPFLIHAKQLPEELKYSQYPFLCEFIADDLFLILNTLPFVPLGETSETKGCGLCAAKYKKHPYRVKTRSEQIHHVCFNFLFV